jgi:cytoskeletal protein RodZ
MSTIGKRLKEARENNQLEIEDIYLKIKISPNILVALENDKADTLLDQLYVRKFLKMYADYLGLDGTAIEKEYIQENNLNKKTKPEPIEEKEPLKVDLPKARKLSFKLPIKLIVKLCALGVAVFLVIFVFNSLKNIIKNRPAETAAVKTEIIDSISSIPEEEELSLSILASEKVWLEIKSDGNMLMKNFLNSGSKETWQAKEYFELSVGKPEAITLWLNGRQLTIPKHKRIRSSRIDHEGLKLK